MKFYSTATDAVTFSGRFKTQKGDYTLDSADYTGMVNTIDGEYCSATINVITQPSVTTNGELEVTMEIPASAKTGVVTLGLYKGEPRVLLGSVQFYLLAADGDDPEYTTTNTTTVTA